MAGIRIRMLRNCIIEGHGEAKIGEEFEASRYTTAVLAGEGAAEYVSPPAKPYAVTTLVPEHGDTAAQKVASAPPKLRTQT